MCAHELRLLDLRELRNLPPERLNDPDVKWVHPGALRARFDVHDGLVVVGTPHRLPPNITR